MTTEHSSTRLLARVPAASMLDTIWDSLCISPFQRRDFLTHLDATNPCKQRYYELRDLDGGLRAGAIVYTLPIDLLTFRGIPSRVRVSFIGVPCSQSAPGLVGPDEEQLALLQRLVHEEPHFLVGLNLDRPLAFAGAVTGRTLPTIVIQRAFPSLNDYRRALRSTYRRRLKNIERLFDDVVHRSGPCADFFDGAMYQQYLDVYERSEAKLEKLGSAFFKKLDARFVIDIYRRRNRLLGWHISILDAGTLYFLFAGHDLTQEGVYFNLLLGVLKRAIQEGAQRIDLGQTAEIPKTRLGGRVVDKFLFATHPSRIVQGLIQRSKVLLEYRRQIPPTRVFRS